jgi:hypothetical protein
MHDSDKDDAPQIEMPRYVCHKRVWALELEAISEPNYPTANNPTPARQLVFRDRGFAPIMASEEMFSRYIPVPGDFYVVYNDGYKSFSPRKAFLEGYTKVQ